MQRMESNDISTCMASTVAVSGREDSDQEEEAANRSRAADDECETDRCAADRYTVRHRSSG